MEYRNGLIAPTASEFPDVRLQYLLELIAEAAQAEGAAA